MIVNDRPFGRLRLDRPVNGAKYLSSRDSIRHSYTFHRGFPFGKELVITEGEFKAFVPLRSWHSGGWNRRHLGSAMVEGKLIPDLARAVSKYHPKIVYFLGDSDAAFLFAFSREAVNLARALPEGYNVRVPRIPISLPKGIDDCREQLGEEFVDFSQKTSSQRH